VKYPAYPEYKETGIQWLGKIPMNWNHFNIKRKVRFAYGDSLSIENRVEGEIPVFGSNGIIGSHKSANTNSPVIIVGRKGSFGKIIYSEEPGFAIDTTYYIDKSKTNSDLKWLNYVLLCLKLDDLSKDSAVPGLSREEAYIKKIPYPSLHEQKTIANFLDYKTTQIDRLIDKNEKLLKLLEEKRTALITQAVTKGLDPHVKMKDSGIEWLGEIPEHWEVKRLKLLVKKVLTGATPSTIGPDYFEDGSINWFTPGDFMENCLHLLQSNRKIRKEAIKNGKLKLFPKNSILIIGIGATLGKVAICEEECSSNQQINIVIPSYNINPKFLLYFLSVMQEVMKIISNATTLGIMNQEKTKQILISIPDSDEQNIICNYIEKYLFISNEITSTIKSAVENLKEYRTSLITAAVTGKIDVRNFKPDAEDFKEETEISKEVEI